MSTLCPGVGAPAGRLFLHGGGAAAGSRVPLLLAWLEAALPWLDWRAHIVVTGTVAAELVEGLLERAADHLERYPFASLTIHPLVAVRGPSLELPGWLVRVLDRVRPFLEAAYQEQTSSRLLLHPVLVMSEPPDPTCLAPLLERLEERLARPRLVLGSEPGSDLLAVIDRASTPVHVLPGCGEGDGTVLERLGAHHVFDSLLDLLDARRGDLLGPCRRHLVVDLDRGGVFPCLGAWREGGAAVALGSGMPGRDAIPVQQCPGCVVRAALEVRGDLELARRHAEGHRVLLALSLALAGQGSHQTAAELAGGAAGLASSDDERAAALLQRGLCCLEAGRLREAEETLVQAADYGADRAATSFYRGRAQMAWQDSIEALDRFEEALAAGSDTVPADHLHLQMAICHVDLAEYSDARRHLERIAGGEHRSVVDFYHGLCDLGEGAPERAQQRLEAALEAGPAEDDLGRVLLYLATSLKEQGRYDQAIPPLERALALSPDELSHHNLLGYCSFKLGRHAEAVAAFRRAVEIDPSSAIDWANLGVNLGELGRAGEARDALRRSLALDPSLSFAAAALTRLAGPT